MSLMRTLQKQLKINFYTRTVKELKILYSNCYAIDATAASTKQLNPLCYCCNQVQCNVYKNVHIHLRQAYLSHDRQQQMGIPVL